MAAAAAAAAGAAVLEYAGKALVDAIIGGLGGKSKVVRMPTEYKEWTNTVERVVNVDKARYEEDQELLAAIMDSAADAFRGEDTTIMAVGTTGSGKSTVLNVFFGGDFPAGESVLDVTCKSSARAAGGATLVDSVGFLPSLGNVGKMCVLFGVNRVLPHHLVIPAYTGRLVDLQALSGLIGAGLVTAVCVPFVAPTYYALLEEGALPEAARRAALKTEQAADMAALVHENHWEGKITIATDGAPPQPAESMKAAFLAAFFCGGKFVRQSFEEHQAGLKELGAAAILRGLMVDATRTLRRHASIEGGRVKKVSELAFMKD